MSAGGSRPSSIAFGRSVSRAPSGGNGWSSEGERVTVLHRTALRVFLKHHGEPDAELMAAMGASIVNSLATLKLTDTHLRRAAGRATGGAFGLLHVAQRLVEIFQARQRERHTGGNFHDLARDRLLQPCQLRTQTPI